MSVVIPIDDPDDAQIDGGHPGMALNEDGTYGPDHLKKHHVADDVSGIHSDGGKGCHKDLNWHGHHVTVAGGIVLVGVILGILFGIVLVTDAVLGGTVADETAAAVTKVLAGKSGTSSEPASILPAKGASARRRRLVDFESDHVLTDLDKFLRGTPIPSSGRRLADNADISAFSKLSDYSLQPEPSMSVAEEAADILNLVNQIGCSVSQTLGYQVGLNGTCNPGEKKYLAVIDDFKCGSSENTFSNWYLKVTGPNTESGDGDYLVDANILWSGDFPIDFQIISKIENGLKISETLSFHSSSSYGNMKGVVKQTTDHAENTGTLLFLQEALSSPGTITQYLMAEFDKDTFMGSAISGSTGGDEYEINFSGDNYYRKKTDSGGTETLQCVDFSVDSMKIVFNNYNFFLAADGSALKHLSGMPIIMKGVTDYESTVPIDAWISYWGLYANPYRGDTTNSAPKDRDSMQALFVDGATVQKQIQIGDDIDKDYTVSIVNARMRKTERRTIKLSDIQGLPFTVEGTGDLASANLVWTGSAVEMVGRKAMMCLDSSNNYEAVDTSFEPASGWEGYLDCQCLDSATPAGRETSGAFDTTIHAMQYDKLVGTATNGDDVTGDINSESFPYGMRIRIGDTMGQVQLIYQPLQKLFGLDMSTYTADDIVTQASSGASGVVAITTANRLYGYTCASSTCLTVTPKNWASCALNGGSSYQSSYFPKGLILTQGAVTAKVAESSGIWDGLPYTDLSGGLFNLALDITVSLPTDAADLVDLAWMYTLTGTLTAAVSTGISTDWGGISAKAGVNCVTTGTSTASGVYAVFDVDQTTGSQVGFYQSSSGDVWSWSENAGSGCSTSSAVLSSEIISKINTASVTCDTYPTVTVTCAASDRATAKDVTVLLESTSSTKFVSSWNGGSDILVNDVSKGELHWEYTKSGPTQAIDGDTEVVYEVQSIVNAGDTSIPSSLSCYDRCPELTDANTLATCDTDCDYDPISVAGALEVSQDGECSTEPDDANFVGILGLTFADLTLTYGDSEDSSGNPVYVLERAAFANFNHGHTCDSQGATITLSTTGAAHCATYPALKIDCEQGMDDAMGSHARKYSFDPNAGLITDSTTTHTQTTSSSSYHQSFGNFFNASSANLAKLVCDHDSSLLCPWKVYEQLDTFYTYDTGNDAYRLALVDDSDVLPFSKPKTFVYKHTTSEASNSGRNYQDSMFFVEWYGPGERLRGLPEMCMADDGTQGDCLPNSDRIADINIPEGAILTGVGADGFNGVEFVVKPDSALEYYPNEINATPCTDLGLQFTSTPALTLPSVADIYTEPSYKDLNNPPSAQDLIDDFALQGKVPLAFGGTPLFEMDGTDGNCQVS